VFGIDRDSESSPLDDDLNNPIRNVALTTHIQEVLSQQKNTPKACGPRLKSPCPVRAVPLALNQQSNRKNDNGRTFQMGEHQTPQGRSRRQTRKDFQ